VDRRVREKERWHIGKEVPITFVATIFVQTLIFVWAASGLYTKVENVVDQLKTFAVERYTKEDARRDKELMLLVIDSLKTRDNEIERRILKLERHDSDPLPTRR
jgi:hypothetical protein